MSALFQRFKRWIIAKWEVADTWLPWVLGIASAMILIIGLFAGFVRSHVRTPAGFVEISDSEIPAKTIYADDPGEVKSGRLMARARHAASVSSETNDHGGRSLIVVLARTMTNEEFEQRTGVPVARGRIVVIATNALPRVANSQVESHVRLDLFPDVAPNFNLKMTSDYQVNQGIHTGYAPDDPESRATLTTADGMMSGFVTYRGKDYRVVPDAARGVHYIVEVRK